MTLTVNLTSDLYYLVFAASGGAVGCLFVLWVVTRKVHQLIVAGTILAAFGWTLFSYSMYCRQPTVAEYPSETQKEVYKTQMAAWQARSELERDWLRPAWPAFLILGAGGCGMVGFVWYCFMNNVGEFAPVQAPGST